MKMCWAFREAEGEGGGRNKCSSHCWLWRKVKSIINCPKRYDIRSWCGAVAHRTENSLHRRNVLFENRIRVDLRFLAGDNLNAFHQIDWPDGCNSNIHSKSIDIPFRLHHFEYFFQSTVFGCIAHHSRTNQLELIKALACRDNQKQIN